MYLSFIQDYLKFATEDMDGPDAVHNALDYYTTNQDYGLRGQYSWIKIFVDNEYEHGHEIGLSDLIESDIDSLKRKLDIPKTLQQDGAGLAHLETVTLDPILNFSVPDHNAPLCRQFPTIKRLLLLYSNIVDPKVVAKLKRDNFYESDVGIVVPELNDQELDVYARFVAASKPIDIDLESTYESRLKLGSNFNDTAFIKDITSLVRSAKLRFRICVEPHLTSDSTVTDLYGIGLHLFDHLESSMAKSAYLLAYKLTRDSDYSLFKSKFPTWLLECDDTSDEEEEESSTAEAKDLQATDAFGCLGKFIGDKQVELGNFVLCEYARSHDADYSDNIIQSCFGKSSFQDLIFSMMGKVFEELVRSEVMKQSDADALCAFNKAFCSYIQTLTNRDTQRKNTNTLENPGDSVEARQRLRKVLNNLLAILENCETAISLLTYKKYNTRDQASYIIPNPFDDCMTEKESNTIQNLCNLTGGIHSTIEKLISELPSMFGCSFYNSPRFRHEVLIKIMRNDPINILPINKIALVSFMEAKVANLQESFARLNEGLEKLVEDIQPREFNTLPSGLCKSKGCVPSLIFINSVLKHKYLKE